MGGLISRPFFREHRTRHFRFGQSARVSSGHLDCVGPRPVFDMGTNILLDTVRCAQSFLHPPPRLFSFGCCRLAVFPITRSPPGRGRGDLKAWCLHGLAISGTFRLRGWSRGNWQHFLCDGEFLGNMASEVLQLTHALPLSHPAQAILAASNCIIASGSGWSVVTVARMGAGLCKCPRG